MVTILGSQDSTNLPRESVDLVFLSDVYHHLENPEKTIEPRSGRRCGPAAGWS